MINEKFLTIIIACSLFFSCGSGHDNPKQDPEPEEPVEVPYEMPCSCMDEWIYQEETACQQELPWDFPVKPGTEEWDQFQTHEEIVDACQIPEEILVSLSTEDLTEICMQCPIINIPLSHEHYDAGLDDLFSKFNGVRELFQREDLSKGLLKWYRCAILKLSDKTISKAEEARLWYYVYCWEVLSSRCKFQDKEEYIDALKHLVCGYEKHILYRLDDLGSGSFMAAYDNFFARVHIINKIEERILEESLTKIPETTKLYLFYRGFANEQTMPIINELTCQLIKER